MDRGLVAPLSPNEEIALRRVAHGSVDIPARHAERLVKLALVAADGSGLRLTAVGVRRVRGLTDAAIDEHQVLASKPEDKIAAAIWMPPIRPEPAKLGRDEWLKRARRKLLALREGLLVHRQQMQKTLSHSAERIEISQSLLRATERSSVRDS